ncbi:MAG: EAL domain-containing protein [Granulosicoccus sp.]
MALLRVPIWVFNVNAWAITWINQSGMDFWAIDDDAELYTRDWSVDMSSTIRKRSLQLHQDCHESQQTFHELWTLTPNGVPKVVELCVSPFVEFNGQKSLLIQVPGEVASKESEVLHRTTALTHTSTMISIYDANLELVYCNPSARESLQAGCTQLGQRLKNQTDLELINAALQSADNGDFELEVITSEGLQWHSMNIRRSPNAYKSDVILISASNITEQKKAQQEAYHLAYNDSLTGLPNRAALNQYLDNLLNKDNKEDVEFGLFFLDLDRFKLINDSLGHAYGDLLLIEVASRLTKAIGSNGSVYRLGGDEFVIIVNDVSATEDLRDAANTVLHTMSGPVTLSDNKVRVLPSIGICRYPIDASSANSLMQNADAAMYLAKAHQSGFRFYDEQMSVAMNHSVKNRLDLEHDLVAAVENEEFELHYQPKLSSKDLSITGVEALIRWNHPTRGMVPPDEFISIAEETRQIIELGNWVLEAAMKQQRLWHSQGLCIPVSVNISAKQFAADDLLMSVSEALTNTRCDPAMIELEITESMLLGDAERVHETLQQLSIMGVRLALDDFGTGYSNLAYLQDYPLDTLKIDRIFLAGQKHAMLLDTILSMGKVLGLTVVAEGVETKAQLEWLQKRGCDQLQGYYFSRPLRAEHATAYLEENQAQKQLGDSSEQRAA